MSDAHAAASHVECLCCRRVLAHWLPPAAGCLAGLHSRTCWPPSTPAPTWPHPAPRLPAHPTLAVCVLLPCLMYTKVYQPTGGKLMGIKAVNVGMVSNTADCFYGLVPGHSAACCCLLGRPSQAELPLVHTRHASPQPPGQQCASPQPAPADPLHLLQAVVAVAALIGSSRDLVVSWSEGFTLFQ